MDGFFSIHGEKANLLRRSTAFLLFCLFALQPVRGQVDFGVRAGLNMSETTLEGISHTTVGDLFKMERHDGYFIGPVLRVGLPVSCLGIDVAALYDVRKTEISGKQISMRSVVVPVNARLDLPLLRELFGVYLTAGPQLSFNIGHEGFSWTDVNSVQNTFRVQSSNFGFNAGAGVRVFQLEVGVIYHMPIGRTADLVSLSQTAQQIYEIRSANTNNWQINLAWYF